MSRLVKILPLLLLLWSCGDDTGKGTLKIVCKESGLLYLDDKEIGQVEQNEVKVLEVEASPYLLSLKTKDGRAQKQLNLGKGDIVLLEIGMGSKEKVKVLSTHSIEPEVGLNIYKDSRDGEQYETVRIGSQVWMTENMRYNVSKSKLNPANPSEKYGRLYKWEQAKEACPNGWHLPSDEEWKLLEQEMGMSESEVNASDYKKDKEGKLKSTSGWINEGSGNNSSGFNVLPAGYYMWGKFRLLGKYTYFWTSTEESKNRAWYRFLYYRDGELRRSYENKNSIYSCRCIKN